MSKEAMKLALEAVEELHRTGDTQVFDMYCAQPVIKALKEALAKQEQGEPVAWRYKPNGNARWFFSSVEVKQIHFVNYTVEPLYTTPQQRTWVGLTDEDDIDWEDGGNLKDLVKAIEAKLREKNT